MLTLYDKVCSYDNLLLAYKKARQNKTSKWYVINFEKELERNLLKLESELRQMTYKPHPLRNFIICDPKTRKISSSHFRDRVVHHALCNIIEPIFEKTYIYDSYASRKFKGTHAALRRFDKFKVKVSKNGRPLRRSKDRNAVIGYVLKADVRHYFENVDHAVLLSTIQKKIKDEKILKLVEIILSNHTTKEPGKGMPIGNLTSQFFANVYLNGLDYFVKHTLRAKYYIRYLDDFVILHNEKNILTTWKSWIDEFLRSEMTLELHPDKSKIYPLRNGVNFLGFRVFYYHKLLKKSNAIRIRYKIDHFIDLHRDGIMSEENVIESVEGWNAYAMHGNTYKLRRKIMKELKKSLKSSTCL